MVTIGPTDMSNLDEKISIIFISEDGTEGIFYPSDASEFIDYLVESDDEMAREILSDNFEPTQEIVEFLQEAIPAYIEESDTPDGCNEYYSELKSFLENSTIESMHISTQDIDEDDDEEIEESILEFLQTDGWISSTILESIDDLIEEVLYRKVVRGGKVLKKANCPPGSKWNGRSCVRMGALEVRKRMKAAFRAAKTRKKHGRNLMFQKAIMKKRNKSMKFGSNRGLY